MTRMARFSKDQVKAFVKENNLKTMDDVQSALKELFAERVCKIFCVNSQTILK